ncbi:MBL fold metallo-hydrolase [Mycobacterium avium]|uniref:MBL fold metallo-hydrolase n=1 Tax=Mycobacterium avium TaxID=1764 RepID=UPI00079FD865|nr:MBL fold metallo-hydrolase [Mycobacterium avium]
MTPSTVVAEQAGLRIERVVTAGTFCLDGGTWEVENNVWILGSDNDVVIIDAAHDADVICAAVGTRAVTAVICTHGHNDHVNVAELLAKKVHAPVLLHPADTMLWQTVHGDAAFMPLHDGQRIGFAGTEISVLHTPGHSPGSVCLHLPEAGAIFSGDTLFEGGPGATGRSYSDFPTIISSIRERIFSLDAETRVHTGHGPSTRVGGEAPFLEEWIARGY